MLYCQNFLSFFWRYIYLSLGISLSCSFLIVSELFCCDFFESFVILSEILLQLESPVASAAF